MRSGQTNGGMCCSSKGSDGVVWARTALAFLLRASETTSCFAEVKVSTAAATALLALR